MATVVRVCKSLDHESDGFIATPINDGVRVGTHPRCLKYKFAPTVDVKLTTDASGTLDIWCDDHGRAVKLADVFATVRFELQDNGRCSLLPNREVIVECFIAEHKKNVFSLSFHRIRADREAPNSVGTMKAVVQEVREGVGLEELVAIGNERKKKGML
jgi:hypothetical protein